MDVSQFYSLLKSDFPHNTTAKQDIALHLLSKFVLNDKKNEVFFTQRICRYRKDDYHRNDSQKP